MAKYINTDLIFKNRTEAGELLAQRLINYKLEDPIVIGLPRGGMTVAKPIADKLKTNLDVLVSKKIGAPNNPELAIGAVTSHGDYVIAPYINYELGENKWDYIQKQIVDLINECKEKEKKYLSCRDAPMGRLLENKNIILVDDGTATGMTALAAIKSIKKQNPRYLVLAIPVISFQAFDEINLQVHRIEALKIPREFIAVGVHYLDFTPTSDEEIIKMLVST